MSPNNKEAVSETVGEMLMLAIVLILLAVFSSSVSNFLPEPRDPSMTIAVRFTDQPDPSLDTLELHHKGGDLVRSSDLSLVLEGRGSGGQPDITLAKTGNPGVQVISVTGDPEIFDLGDIIRITNESGSIPGDLRQVRVSTSHAVIYSGRV